MEKKLLHLSYSLGSIDTAVKQFWDTLNGYNIFAFNGAMGAGKTTFIHHLCDYLKVEDAVSSPTFALINEYHFADATSTDKTIFHLDWYRLKNTDEAINAGMQDCLEQAERGEAYCFVEWPSVARDLLQSQYVWIDITATTSTEREMEISLMINDQ